MSEAKYCLVARASILASGDTDDFHHVAPDEVVLVAVESLEQARRERDEARADAALLRIALENAEPIEAERDDLRAEVERLRGLILSVERAPNAPDACPWCRCGGWHESDCPAFSARGEVRR